MTTGTSWLDASVTLYQSVLRTDGDTIPLRMVLASIRGEAHREHVGWIRRCMRDGDVAEADAAKRRLPAVVVSGDYSAQRLSGQCRRYLGYVVVDIDACADAAEVARIKALVMADPHSGAAFDSPRGCGLKVLFHTDAAGEEWHFAAWSTAARLVSSLTGLPIQSATESAGAHIDGAGSDPVRLCFLSHDPEAAVNEHPAVLVIDRALGTRVATPPSAPSDPGKLPPGQRHAFLVSHAANLRNSGASEAEILAALTVAASERCQGTKPAAELAAIARHAAGKAASRPTELSMLADAIIDDEPAPGPLDGPDLVDGLSDPPPKAAVVIDGLARLGQVMTIVAAPKTGKTWATMAFGLAIAGGGAWWGFSCHRNPVLFIDNESDPADWYDRMGTLIRAYRIEASTLATIRLWSLADHDLRLDAIEHRLMSLPREQVPRVVFIDALYLALPDDVDENDNRAMTGVYRRLRRIARRLGILVIVVHHTSKGIQGGKSVTDVGSGASAPARMAQVYMAIRPHRDDGYLCVHTVARGFPEIPGFVVFKNLPVFQRCGDDMSADDLEGAPERRDGPDEDAIQERLRAALADGLPRTLPALRSAMRQWRFTGTRVTDAIHAMHEAGTVFPWSRHRWASVVEPAPEVVEEQRESIDQRILAADPSIPAKQLAKQLGTNHMRVQRIRSRKDTP